MRNNYTSIHRIVLFIATIFIVTQLSLQAQTVAQDASLAQLGTEMYNFGDKKDALDLFLQALEINPRNAQANYMAGMCYLETIQKFLCVNYFIHAFELNSDIAPDILFKIARGYHLGGNFDEAISYYKQYDAIITKDLALKLKSSQDEEHKKIARKVFECANGKEFYKKPLQIKIEPIDEIVNSEYPDYAPAITSNQNEIIFTSRRSGGTSKNKDVDNEFFEDIWISRKKGSKWSDPINMGSVVNSETHDASIGFSSDGKILFVYKPSNGGDIYECTRLNDTLWSAPKSMGYPINSRYNEPSVSISNDGKIIYFSSDRPGGYGNLDIYKSEKQPDGQWSNPTNLGPTINSEYDEDGPFISLDSKTLYFSSRGHKGMGEYDIFKSNFEANQWTTPSNMSQPINSPDNDIYFVMSGDNMAGYYSSAKNGGLGGNDIYVIDFSPLYKQKKDSLDALTKAKSAEKSVKKPSTPLDNLNANPELAKYTKVKFKIIDDKLGIPLENAKITVAKLGNENEIKEYTTNSKGEVELSLMPGWDYGIEVQKDGYLLYSDNIDVLKTAENEFINKQLALQKAKAGTKIVLKNVFFESGKTMLKPESKSELDIIYQFLSKNNTFRIEVSGHTDNVGTDQVNNKISHFRAKSVADYLIVKGIEKSRLLFMGYGKTRPIADNTTEEGRIRNRRTEFEIIH